MKGAREADLDTAKLILETAVRGCMIIGSLLCFALPPPPGHVSFDGRYPEGVIVAREDMMVCYDERGKIWALSSFRLSQDCMQFDATAFQNCMSTLLVFLLGHCMMALQPT